MAKLNWDNIRTSNTFVKYKDQETKSNSDLYYFTDDPSAFTKRISRQMELENKKKKSVRKKKKKKNKKPNENVQQSTLNAQQRQNHIKYDNYSLDIKLSKHSIIIIKKIKPQLFGHLYSAETHTYILPIRVRNLLEFNPYNIDLVICECNECYYLAILQSKQVVSSMSDNSIKITITDLVPITIDKCFFESLEIKITESRNNRADIYIVKEDENIEKLKKCIKVSIGK